MKRKKVKVECMTKPNWIELPIDLTKNILRRLDTVEIVTSARNVCPLWWNVCKDPLMWSTIKMTGDFSNPLRLDKMCTASHLRRLQILGNTGISDKGLSEFLKRFSQLEELEISHCCNSFSKDILEVIGQCCPLLKSLNLERLSVDGMPTVYSYCKGDEAFCIAKTMSGLRHLKLLGLWLNYDELLAILDGCPLLESLDLRFCIYYSSNQSLLKRCSEQIKDFHHPLIY
ncbi:putative F-box/LRR-repeat protein 23 [Medicago truncatula]|uniref:putative F-box/LRR-repeat protein 23 n=1 Tax=Medicago truncatula TaxID=3880 RepID=UPI000D2F3E41|nr:putative F-box/LRR-repeat protein 23 [Medicago truncatula]